MKADLKIICQMKKLILILFVFPLLGWSQKLDFNQEQEVLVNNFIEMYDSGHYTSYSVFLEDMEIALSKAPYHPKLVALLLQIYFSIDYDFITNYCNKLDDDYLFANQNILVDDCAAAYSLKNDVSTLNNRIIPLIEDQNIKDFYVAFLFYLNGDYDTTYNHFIELFSVSYEFVSISGFKHDVFVRLISYLSKNSDNQRLISIINKYEDVIYYKSTNGDIKTFGLDIQTWLIMIYGAINDQNYQLAEKLIKHSVALNNDNYKAMHIATAFLNSRRGDENTAIEYFEKALQMDDSAFEKIINNETGSINIVHFYLYTLDALTDFKAKEKLTNQALIYFENRYDYWIRLKLYQSMLYASKDLKKAQSILETYEDKLFEQSYHELNLLLRIENEISKRKPNHKLIDDLLGEIAQNNNELIFNISRIYFRYKVNYNSKKLVFNNNETIELIDHMIQNPLNDKAKNLYILLKVVLMAEEDTEKALIELQNLQLQELEQFQALQESIANKKIESAFKSINPKHGVNDIYSEVRALKVNYLIILPKIKN
ncbi:hypothetical protein [Paucihalobacter sp.]|uniref:hypothetical protein n=1 Tax=Paucihalobacter sp. TaxID=2850405 RepID=UPI002FDF2AAB